MSHRNCITDPLTRELWREYQHVVREGNALGLSFTEYVAHRVLAGAPRTVTAASTSGAPWHVATCGHRHLWGESCSSVTA